MKPLMVQHRHLLHSGWYSVCPNTKNLSSPSFHHQCVSRLIHQSGYKSESPLIFKHRNSFSSANRSTLSHARDSTKQASLTFENSWI
ncbi:hypothetical protein ES288_A07G208100v1 [Gossypium darwinii]|uniref:Uncharacterized protein n=1 Tax=Gossypium darwinii TaxID=34276 RepID=A0A5D2FZW1_GOSDA|nr:hypothetical protein ES288_A07G208100v1 [Gossypium darwinii]